MNKIMKFFLLLLVGIILASCGQDDSIAKSDQQRVLNPAISPDVLETLVDGNNRFAIDLYHALGAQDENLLYSPYSISLALAMVYAGARGDTEAQMAEALHFSLPQDELHAAFNRLDLDLAQKSEVDDEEAQTILLDIANATWVQQDYDFLPDYLDLLASNYGAGIHLADFKNRAEQATAEINLWVSDQTHERIQNVISPDALGELTRLVLVNAVYFNADWDEPFDVEDTHLAPFYLLDGSQTPVNMMVNHLTQPYTAGVVTASGVGYQAVRLPYVDRTLAMEIIVPHQGQFASFEAAMDWQLVDAILGGMRNTDLILNMPKFTFRSSFFLANRLRSIGMPDAFNRGLADFSGMDGTQELNIDDIIHQAFVAVDETGTEAAAVTIVGLIEGVIALKGPEPIELTIDRPFIFFIRDLSSGQILFVGRVLNAAPG